MPYLIILILGIALIYFLSKYLKLHYSFETKLAQYKDTELQKTLTAYNIRAAEEMKRRVDENEKAATQKALDIVAKWQMEYEEATRKDAISKSQAIMMGKTLEHLIPYFPEFRFNPRDARFLGSPVDLIVFDGLSEGKLRQIVFVEIKTNTSQLNVRETQIRDIVEKGKVVWAELRHEINRIVKP